MSLIEHVLKEGFEYLTQEQLDSLRISVSAIIFKKGKVILLEHSKTGKVTLPGGALDKGERPIEGMLRELKEELGVTDVTVLTAPYVNTGEHADLHIGFHIHTEDLITNMEKEKHPEVIFCERKDLTKYQFTESADLLLRSFGLLV